MLKTALLALVALWTAVALGDDAPAPGPDVAPEMTITVSAFQIEGDNPLDATATAAALEPFKGEYAGLDGVLAAADTLEAAFREQGYSFHRVVVPPQDMAGGMLLLKVVTFTLADINVSGQTHFTEASVKRSLPGLKSGAPPDLGELSRELAVANLHPGKQIKLGFKESKETPDALDAAIKVRDVRPWSLFANANNIGNKDTGRSRLAVGGQHSNITGHDDVLTGSFTTSPDNADDVQQYGAYYQVPVYPLGGWLSAFYVRSDVDVGNVQGFFDVSGGGEFVGVAFKRQLLGVGRYRQTFSAGLQDRLFDTGIATSGTGLPLPGISTKVRSRPVSLRYDGGYNWAATSLDFYFDFTQNMSFGGHNNERDYSKLRAPADPDWKVVRFGSLVTYRLPRDYLSVTRLTGQYTNEPLIPGEQLGFGGERTIRGFEERTISGDKGLLLNLELWSPPVARLYGIRFLAFFDAGHKVLEKPLSGQRHNDTMSSVGVGARWQWRNQLTFAFDYGQPLASADGEAADRGNSKWHMNIQYRY